jgi:2-keto-3-deoxy-L-rhamnonate aldolase RhmA
MEPINVFREKMRAGRVCMGPGITFSDPLVTHALADSVDFFWIDLEHATMSFEALHGHLLAAHSKGVPCIVRVTGSATPFIKPVLDCGADGIIVPQVVSAEEVRHIVSDCRYPPAGRRGFGPRVPSNYGREGGRAYLDRENANVFVCAQIESREAYDDLDAIVAIPGLDAIALGPQDLSGSFGLLGEVEHPTVVAAIQAVIDKGRRAGKFVGAGMGNDPDYATLMARRGVQWLQVGSDYTYLIQTFDQIASGVRQRLA